MSQPVLAVSNLTKYYGPYLAVDDVSFQIKEGEVLGLLGPNGAGKTTTIQMLLGLTTLDAGKIEYFGRDFAKHREYCLSRINFASAYSKLLGKITVRQSLRIYAEINQVPNFKQKIAELAEILEIEPHLDSLFWKLSSGQQTRAILAKALLNSPKLLLMDEPTASLDPDIVDKIISLIERLKNEQGVSILFTSHNMEEVTRVCDRVMFLQGGKIVAENTPLGLTKQIDRVQVSIAFDGEQKPVSSHLTKQKWSFEFSQKNRVEIFVSEKEVPAVLFGLSKQDVWMTDIDIKNTRN